MTTIFISPDPKPNKRLTVTLVIDGKDADGQPDARIGDMYEIYVRPGGSIWFDKYQLAIETLGKNESAELTFVSLEGFRTFGTYAVEVRKVGDPLIVASGEIKLVAQEPKKAPAKPTPPPTPPKPPVILNLPPNPAAGTATPPTPTPVTTVAHPKKSWPWRFIATVIVAVGIILVFALVPRGHSTNPAASKSADVATPAKIDTPQAQDNKTKSPTSATPVRKDAIVESQVTPTGPSSTSGEKPDQPKVVTPSSIQPPPAKREWHTEH